jgi:hypothetical protein
MKTIEPVVEAWRNISQIEEETGSLYTISLAVSSVFSIIV